jgi:Glycosyl hydrolase 108
MATLPKTSVRAERPSTAAVDFGVLGQGVAALGEGVARGMATVQRQQAQSADRWAEQAVTSWKAQHETQLAQETARYDGSKPGLTQAVLDTTDRSFQPLLDAESDPIRRQALLKQFDGYRAQVGQRVSAFEAEKRAEPMRREQAASEDLALSSLLIERSKALAAAQQARGAQGAAGMVGYADGTASDFDAATEQVAKGVTNPALLARFRERSVADRFAMISKAQGVEEAARQAVVGQTVKSNIEALQNGLLVNPAGYDDAVKLAPNLLAAIPDPALRAKLDGEVRPLLARSYLSGLVNTGQIDVAKTILARGDLDKTLTPNDKQNFIELIQRTEQAAASASAGGQFDGDATAAPGFAAAAGFVVDGLEGGDKLVPNDNGKGATRFGINQAANPDLNVLTITRPQAMTRFRQRYWDAIGADGLPPALAMVAFDAAVNQGVDNARQWLAQSGGDVGKLLSLREAAYRDLAKNPAQAKNLDGWMARLGKVKDRAQRINNFLATSEGFASDPLNFALGDKNRASLIKVSTLEAAAPLSGDQNGLAAWGRALNERAAQGRVLAGEYGVPARMLTNAEKSFYAQQIETDPAVGIRLAQAARAAIGPSGAQALLREISPAAGDAAPVTLHLADLAAGGSPKFATDAARGLALKAKGEKLSLTEANEIRTELDRYRPSLSSTPEVLLAAQQAAEAAMIADKASGTMAQPEYYAHRALGGARVDGRSYGGGAIVQGRPTILPRWLNGDYVDDALRVVGETWSQHDWGPHFANGKPMTPQQISRAALKLLPSGRYQLVDPKSGAVAVRKNGQPFDFNLDGDRRNLAAALGAKAVLGAGQ